MVRFDHENALIIGFCLFELTQHREQLPAIKNRVNMFLIDGDRPIETGKCFRPSLELLEKIAAIIQGVELVGLDCEYVFEASQCIARSPEFWKAHCRD